MRPAMESGQDDELEKVKKELLHHAMRRDWWQVVRTYKLNKQASTAKITRSGDTVLHMAISDSDYYSLTVIRLLEFASKEALRIANDHGNTPLHVAAYLGNARVCRWIANAHPHLIGERNKQGETPIFLAVAHGRKQAFLCMHTIIRRNGLGLGFCGKDDGRTILHSAISGGHFELAFQIIHMYPKLNRNDANGITPLHLLATKPSAFKSGTRMGILRTIVYHCLYIRKLQFHKDEEDPKQSLTFCGHIRSWLYSSQEKDTENPNNDRRRPPLEFGSKGGLDSDYASFCAPIGECLSLIFHKFVTCLTLGMNNQIQKVIEEKRQHKWTVQIMKELVNRMSSYDFEIEVRSPPPSINEDGDGGVFDISDVKLQDLEHQKSNIVQKDGREEISFSAASQPEVTIMVEKTNGNFGITIRDKEDKKGNKTLKQNPKKETPLLFATKHGIIEMVKYILEKYPLAVHNENVDGKNIVLLAVESRQPHVYNFLLKQKILTQTIFYKTDNDGNSALHLAAMLANRRNWLIPGPALQMQWEVKWYEFVEKSMPAKFFMPCNQDGETPWEMFTENHKELAKEASEWLYKTSESCSVVAVLIATVAFTASSTVPGGIESNGTPVLKKQPAFNVFAIASLVALCFSIASVVMFMAFFTSRHREKDYGTNLPAKLLVELTSLLISIAAVLVSFCAAHFFVIKDTFKYTAFSLYAATLFPVALYAFWQIPMYYELVKATARSTPQRVYEHD
ncbi:uncharacterized protein LOC121794434 [Salvia splendens]|uniref:uncharacterized protein LOC121794434 n=1 Tax=Salvia splendens TaxID=180675 RepID=UPI001103EB75|nr:uncharacterized protein LOC121794434 [Salvia splendens]